MKTNSTTGWKNGKVNCSWALYIFISESGSKLQTNFEFCGKIINIQGKKYIYKVKRFILTKNIFKKSMHILEDGASDAQVGVID